MKTILILLGLTNFYSLCKTLSLNNEVQKIDLQYYNNIGLLEYTINRTVLDTLFIDSVRFPHGTIKVDTFIVKDGKWERIIDGKYFSYFSTDEVLKKGFMYSYSRGAEEKYKYVLKNRNYKYFGFSVFELDWYICYLGKEEFVGHVYFHENLGVVLFKGPEWTEIQLKLAIFR